MDRTELLGVLTEKSRHVAIAYSCVMSKLKRQRLGDEAVLVELCGITLV